MPLIVPLVVTTLLVAATPRAVDALILKLSPEDMEEAVAVGTRGLADPDFGAEWRLLLPDGEEIVAISPFSRLAHAARRAAYRGESLAEEQRQQQLDLSAGRLQLQVTMYGTVTDFARWYGAELAVGDRRIKAAFVQNERTALELPDGRFRARNIYVFPLEELPPRGTVTLVVESTIDQQEILRADIDLSKMR